VTVKTVGRSVANVALGVLALPVALVAAVPVGVLSRSQAKNPDVARFNRLYGEIRADLQAILLTLGAADNDANKVYLLRQIGKYLRPGADDSVATSVRQLFDFFNTPVGNMWSYGGWENRTEAGGTILWLGMGYATKNGAAFPGSRIRISPKAFCLGDNTLSGVMLHEATHWVLATEDYAYDTTFFPGHDNLKELAPGLHFSNADNWRIFYQKMRKKLRP
jgi:hypothetical protein